MDSSIPPVDEENTVRKSTDIPSHGTIPKWLEELSRKIERNHSLETKRSFDINDFFSTIKPTNLKLVETESQKFGRRSSLTVQSSKDFLPKSTYIIPPFEDKFDIKTLYSDMYQTDLEKSWRSLDNFNQSHRGRLDSAKNLELNEKHGDYSYNLSPIPAKDNFQNESSSIYSPSLLETNVPIRSRSEMSHYVPHHEKTTTPISSTDLYPRQIKFDPVFERKLNEYQSKIDKENKLREEIISELLTENEIITNKIRQTQSEIDGFTLLPRKLQSTKYKNKSSKKNKETKAAKGSVFIIPELPTGQTLIIDILSTWGDKYYVGLNGIEIFGVDGTLVKVRKITAVPPDVNVLPECNHDPRIVSNLLDGVNRTQDDMHIWLAPFDPGCSHIITVEFEEVTTVSMIRIWNYNKSRIHSYRGVRDIVIFLDDIPIFKGDIIRASGDILGGINFLGDTILFTTEEDILENIAKNDTSFNSLTSGPTSPEAVERPPTSALMTDARPTTGATAKNSPIDQILFGASRIELSLLSNWGHANMIGLTGLEIVEGTNTVVNLEQSKISCSVNSVSSQVTRLIDGVNLTTEAADMWWISFEFGEEITVRIELENFKYISGIRIWNYNGSLETSYAGVRALKILLDGTPLKNPVTKNEIFILRRAPGNLHYDYVQDIRFVEDLKVQEEMTSLLDQDEFYEPSLMPEGFVFQFIIFSTWGDRYYCGLNGLELYDQYGNKIHLQEQNICAYPESVNSLPNVCGDVRIPVKLIDDFNDDHSGSHSWLAPIIPKHLNRIYIVMDQPIIVSSIKVWNYSKTPSRGIKEFGILVDDLLVFNGTLQKYLVHSNDSYQTISFKGNEAVIHEHDSMERNRIFYQDVILLDQDKRTTTGGSLPEADPALRPFTSVNVFNRGCMSLSH